MAWHLTAIYCLNSNAVETYFDLHIFLGRKINKSIRYSNTNRHFGGFHRYCFINR